VDGVGEPAGDDRFAVDDELHDDDARVEGIGDLWQPEFAAEIDYRDGVAAYIDDAAQVAWGGGHAGDMADVEHFTGLEDVDGKHLVAEAKGEVAGGFGDFGRAHGRTG